MALFATGSATGQVGALDNEYCPNARACAWTAPGFAGQKKIIDNAPDQTWINLTGTFRNSIYSVKNFFDQRKIQFAPNDNGGGTPYCVPAGATVSNIHFPNGGDFQSYRVGQQGSSC